MKTRPILFSTPMVEALLRGRKSQTRRVVTLREFGPSDTPGYDWHFRDRRLLWHDYRHEEFLARCCPYGVAGDRLWVRETWAEMCREADPFCWCEDAEQKRRNHYAEYRADTPDARFPGGWADVDLGDDPPGEEVPRWRPSIHMPRWASRLTLELQEVRVERLQDLSEADAVAEGVRLEPSGYGLHYLHPTDKDRRTQSPRLAFAWLWDAINAARGCSWDASPWVWVIDFRRIETEATP